MFLQIHSYLQLYLIFQLQEIMFMGIKELLLILSDVKMNSLVRDDNEVLIVK